MTLAELQARIAELEAANTAQATQITTLNAQVTTLTGERDTLLTAAASAETARRTERLTALFGAEATDAQRAPYLSMSTEQFEAVATALAAKAPAADPDLFRQVAGQGRDPNAGSATAYVAPVGYGVDPERAQLHAKALKYQAEHPNTEYLAAVQAVAV